MPRFKLKTPTEIGALIRARRKTLGMDQADLAIKVGVSRLWINQVERGKPGAGIGLILRTLTALGVDLSWNEPTGASGNTANSDAEIDDIVEKARQKAKR